MEPLTMYTYVQSVDARVTAVGRVMTCRVELANGLAWDTRPEDAPPAGTAYEVTLRPVEGEQ